MPETNEDSCLCRVIHPERIEKANQTALPPNEQERLANLFKAMGDTTRLKILLALSQGEMCVCDITAAVGARRSNVSRHLAVMLRSGVVHSHKDGLKVIYSVKDWYAGSRYCPKSIETVDDEEPNVRARVRRYRDHPALLAWYLNDELSQRFMPQLEAHLRREAEHGVAVHLRGGRRADLLRVVRAAAA